jgi:hypothetical protein
MFFFCFLLFGEKRRLNINKYTKKNRVAIIVYIKSKTTPQFFQLIIVLHVFFN